MAMTVEEELMRILREIQSKHPDDWEDWVEAITGIKLA